MNTLKKGITLLMALLLLATLLAGCGAISAANQKTAQAYIEDYFHENFAKMVSEYTYTPEAKAAITQALLQDSYDSTVKHLGELSDITQQKNTAANTATYLAVFRSGSLLAHVTFNEKNEISAFYIEPYDNRAMPDSITEKEIKFGEQRYPLTGTLTTPKDTVSKTVVILVAGSGPADRNESLGVLKPFRDIAWGLGQKGISVFRYDKRTYTHKAKLAQDNTLTVDDEVVDDVTYAYYKMHALGYENIYLLGHSFGGYLMGCIETELPWADGYIIMAGNVTRLEDLIVLQLKYLAEFDGKVTQEENAQIAEYEKQNARIKSLTKANASSYTAAELMGAPAAYWLDLKEYDPLTTLVKSRGKLLVMQGASDYQVPLREYALWQNGLAENKNVTFKLYDKLNHLFMPSKVMNASDYQTMNYVDNVVIEDIAAFVGN